MTDMVTRIVALERDLDRLIRGRQLRFSGDLLSTLVLEGFQARVAAGDPLFIEGSQP